MRAQSLPTPALQGLQILRTCLRDIRSLYRLEKRCFGVDAWPLIDILFAMILPDLVRLKAVQDGRLVGFVLGQKDRGLGWIATFAVDELYRNRGIGSELLDAAEDMLRTQRIRLCVRKSNTAAIRLYSRRGYAMVTTWKRYYRGGEDALVMEKGGPKIPPPGSEGAGA